MCSGVRVETIIIITVAKIYFEMSRGPLGGLYASGGPDIIYGYIRASCILPIYYYNMRRRDDIAGFLIKTFSFLACIIYKQVYIILIYYYYTRTHTHARATHGRIIYKRMII